MDRKSFVRILITVAFGIGIFIVPAFCEDVVIIDPDPDPVIDPPSDTTPPPPAEVAVVLDIDPPVLNLQGNRSFITAYIELPSGYTAAAIKADSVKMCSLDGRDIAPVFALASPVAVGDSDADQVPDLMVKFDWAAVRPLLSAGEHAVGVSGALQDGTGFTGRDSINVIDRPETVAASIDVDPDTLNLKSNRKWITVYVEVTAGGNAADIDAASVRLYAVNHAAIAPLAAAAASMGDHDADAVPDLMVKFDYGALRPLLEEGQAAIGVKGTLAGGREFVGEDTIRVTHDDDAGATTGPAPKEKGDDAVSSVQAYRFSLNKHLAPDVRIKQVFLWKKSPERAPAAAEREAWYYKAPKKWEAVFGNFSRLYYANFTRGNGCEWNLTDQVVGDWQQGVGEVTVRIDRENAGRRPVLIVIFEASAAATAAGEQAKEKQALSPVGQAFNVVQNQGADDAVTLCYGASDLQGCSEKDLGVYYWDRPGNMWKPVPDCTVDYREKTVTFKAVSPTSYQLMVPRASAPAGNPQPAATNALGQNYPNPFNPATTIRYTIAKDCHVTLRLYNVAGELVATIIDEYQYAGDHSVYYDGGEQLARGIYYYQLVAGDFVDTKRMAVLK